MKTVIGTFVAQEGDKAKLSTRDDQALSATLVGFPSGFKLRKGEKVMLVIDGGARTIHPLVRTVDVPEGVRVEHGTEVEIRGTRYQVSPGAVIEDESSVRVAWVVEPGDAEGPPQIIGTR